jgi:hypothetical protein
MHTCIKNTILKNNLLALFLNQKGPKRPKMAKKLTLIALFILFALFGGMSFSVTTVESAPASQDEIIISALPIFVPMGGGKVGHNYPLIVEGDVWIFESYDSTRKIATFYLASNPEVKAIGFCLNRDLGVPGPGSAWTEQDGEPSYEGAIAGIEASTQARAFAMWVELGQMSIEDVPDRWQEETQAVLDAAHEVGPQPAPHVDTTNGNHDSQDYLIVTVTSVITETPVIETPVITSTPQVNPTEVVSTTATPVATSTPIPTPTATPDIGENGKFRVVIDCPYTCPDERGIIIAEELTVLVKVKWHPNDPSFTDWFAIYDQFEAAKDGHSAFLLVDHTWHPGTQVRVRVQDKDGNIVGSSDQTFVVPGYANYEARKSHDFDVNLTWVGVCDQVCWIPATKTPAPTSTPIPTIASTPTPAPMPEALPQSGGIEKIEPTPTWVLWLGLIIITLVVLGGYAVAPRICIAFAKIRKD